MHISPHFGSWPRIAFIFIATIGAVADQGERKFSIPFVLQHESFQPTLPTEKDLLSSYGRGVLQSLHNQSYRVYRDQTTGLWIGCRIEDDDKINRPVTAIIVSKIPLSPSRSAPGIKLPLAELHGIQIGDQVHHIIEKAGTPKRIYEKRLTDEFSFRTYEYFPKGTDSCLRFYVEKEHIVAMSVSSEE